MGLEYFAKIDNVDYTHVIKALTDSFQVFSEIYRIESDENSLSLFRDNRKWNEVLEIKVQTANELYAPPSVHIGEQYLYFLYYDDEIGLPTLYDCMEATFKKMGYSYLIDET